MIAKIKRVKKLRTPAIQSLFNKAIVDRDGKCVICRKTENLQCSHFYTVGAHSGIRFRPWNANTMCAGCHLKHHNADPYMYVRWYENHFPERLKWLTSIKNNSIRYSQFNLGVIKNILKEKNMDELTDCIHLLIGVEYRGE
jgi:cytochrome c553